MPIVHIELWPQRTHEEKAEAVKAITDDVVRIFKVSRESVIIVFNEVDKENAATAGVLVADRGK